MQLAEVILGLFHPANQQSSEVVNPAMASLHDPAPGFVPKFFDIPSFFASGTDMSSKLQC